MRLPCTRPLTVHRDPGASQRHVCETRGCSAQSGVCVACSLATKTSVLGVKVYSCFLNILDPPNPQTSRRSAGYVLEKARLWESHLPPVCHLHVPFPGKVHVMQGSSEQVRQSQINDVASCSPGEGSGDWEVACIALCLPFDGSLASDGTPIDARPKATPPLLGASARGLSHLFRGVRRPLGHASGHCLGPMPLESPSCWAKGGIEPDTHNPPDLLGLGWLRPQGPWFLRVHLPQS